MEISYDPDINVGYIRFGKSAAGSVADTINIDELDGLERVHLNLDLDKEGRLIGIELLDLKETLFGDGTQRLVVRRDGSQRSHIVQFDKSRR